MTYLNPLSHKGSVAPYVLLGLLTCAAGAVLAGPCPSSGPALTTLVAAEYAFAAGARVSVRQAFLDNLADDAWVLQPGPTPGKAWYQAHPDGRGRLAWYPHVADVAPSGDLGFTSGPYVYERDGTRAFGQFLTVWRLGADCRWRVAFDGGIAHARLPEAAGVDPSSASATGVPGQPPEEAVSAFQSVAAREGLSAALRTYAHNGNFLMLLDGDAPMDLDHAERRLRRRVVKEVWREAARGASRDASLSYVVGGLGAGAYAQVWQYDARTANLGLRVLLLTGP